MATQNQHGREHITNAITILSERWQLLLENRDSPKESVHIFQKVGYRIVRSGLIFTGLLDLLLAPTAVKPNIYIT
jgi:hypothetical protein